MTRTRVLDLLLTSLAPIVWGSTYIVTTELLPPDRPLLASTLRALPAGVILVMLTGARVHGVWRLRTAVLGSLNIGVFFFLLFVAAYELPGGVAALVGSVQPLFVLVLGAILLQQRVAMTAVASIGIGMAGVAMLVLRSDADLSATGVLAGTAAALSMAAGIVLTKSWGRPPGVGVLGFTGLQLTAGGLVLLPTTLLVEGLPNTLDARNVMGFGYLAVIGALVAYTLWFRGIERLPALTVSFLGFFSPLAAVLLGWLLLGQVLTPSQAVGAALVVAAVLLSQRPGSPRRAGDALTTAVASPPVPPTSDDQGRP